MTGNDTVQPTDGTIYSACTAACTLTYPTGIPVGANIALSVYTGTAPTLVAGAGISFNGIYPSNNVLSVANPGDNIVLQSAGSQFNYISQSSPGSNTGVAACPSGGFDVYNEPVTTPLNKIVQIELTSGCTGSVTINFPVPFNDLAPAVVGNSSGATIGATTTTSITFVGASSTGRIILMGN